MKYLRFIILLASFSFFGCSKTMANDGDIITSVGVHEIEDVSYGRRTENIIDVYINKNSFGEKKSIQVSKNIYLSMNDICEGYLVVNLEDLTVSILTYAGEKFAMYTFFHEGIQNTSKVKISKNLTLKDAYVEESIGNGGSLTNSWIFIQFKLKRNDILEFIKKGGEINFFNYNIVNCKYDFEEEKNSSKAKFIKESDFDYDKYFKKEFNPDAKKVEITKTMNLYYNPHFLSNVYLIDLQKSEIIDILGFSSPWPTSCKKKTDSLYTSWGITGDYYYGVEKYIVTKNEMDLFLQKKGFLGYPILP